MIAIDSHNPASAAFAEKLRERVPEVDDLDLVVVLGGDGFLLRKVAQLGFDRTYLGLNAGRLGFLLNDVSDWDAIGEWVREGAYTVHAFPTLHAEVHTVDDVVVDHAINDVYLERMSGQTAHLNLVLAGHPVVDSLVADGIVLSTALGSTAYTFSAGGPACHPTLEIMLATPICPHRPRLSPFALPRQARVHIEVLAPERRPVRAVVDGREVDDVRQVDIRMGDERVQLAYFEGHDFTSTMIRKILRP